MAELPHSKIYLNPATVGAVKIEASSAIAGPVDATIIDATGRVLMHIEKVTQRVIEFSVNNFPAGAYNVRLTTENEVSAQRLMIVK